MTEARIGQEIEKELRSLLGTERVSTDELDLITYAYDATRKNYPPSVIVWPTTTEQVAAVMRVATRERIPVYPRGSGSGMTGGALATGGGILLSLERMDRILKIDKANRTVTAQPGNSALNQPVMVPTHFVTQSTLLTGSRRSRLSLRTHLRVLPFPLSMAFAFWW